MNSSKKVTRSKTMQQTCSKDDPTWKARMVAELSCQYIESECDDIVDILHFAKGVEAVKPDLSGLFRNIIQANMADHIENIVRKWSHIPSDGPPPRRHMKYTHYCVSLWHKIIKQVESIYDEAEMLSLSPQKKSFIKFKDLQYDQQLRIILEAVTNKRKNVFVYSIWNEFLEQDLDEYREQRFEEELDGNADMNEMMEDVDFDVVEDMIRDISMEAAQDACDDLAADVKTVWMSIFKYMLAVMKNDEAILEQSQKAAEVVFMKQRQEDAEFFLLTPVDLWQHRLYNEWILKGTAFGVDASLDEVELLMELSSRVTRPNGYDTAFSKKLTQVQKLAKSHPESFKGNVQYLHSSVESILKRTIFLSSDYVIAQVAEDCMVDTIMKVVLKNKRLKKQGLEVIPDGAFRILAERFDLESVNLCPCCIQEEMEGLDEVDKDMDEVKKEMESRILKHFIDTWKTTGWRYIKV